MAEIHAVAGFRNGQQNGAIEPASGIDFPEDENPADGHQEHACSVVDPCCFPSGSQPCWTLNGELSGSIVHDHHDEAAEADGKAHQPCRQCHGQRLAPREVADEATQVEPQEQIADEATEIVEQAVGVPAGLAPERIECAVGNARRTIDDGCGTVGSQRTDEGNERGGEAQQQIELQLALADALGPRREHRHEQIDAHEHVDKPQVAGGIVEVEQQRAEVIHRLAPGKCIDDAPTEERHQHPQGAAAQELACAVVQRKLQIARCHDEQRHAGPHESIEERRPVGIALGQDARSLATQIERFCAVDDHHHQAGRHAHPVNPFFSVHCEHNCFDGPKLRKNNKIPLLTNNFLLIL